MSVIEHITTKLSAEYSNAIDPSTLLAIVSDYDLTDATQLETARQVLDMIKENVEIEEESGFDASATHGTGFLIDDTDPNHVGEDESLSARSGLGWTSQTDDTILSQEMSLMDLKGLDFGECRAVGGMDESPHKQWASELDQLSDVEKEEALIDMFPGLGPFDIRWALKKLKGNAALAVDVLITESFLEETGSRPKGIDAFSEIQPKSKKRTGKNRKALLRNQKGTNPAADNTPSDFPVQSKWDTARQDVEFLSQKTGMSMQQVTSLYHKNGASTQTTISAIIAAYKALELESDDPMLQINAYNIQQDFTGVSKSEIEALLRITHPSIEDARDLAKVLASRPTNRTSGNIQIELRHSPIDLEPKPTKAKLFSYNAVQPVDLPSAVENESSLRQRRTTAYTQAGAAYRKGNSENNMRAAAGYFSQKGRDYTPRIKSAASAAADALVASQSTRTELDLHGVNVKDATRISRERVTTWWHELGEGRINERGVGYGFKIITGVGTHSEGGKGKLGPAVCSMLIREGWKTQTHRGYIMVFGVQKRH